MKIYKILTSFILLSIISCEQKENEKKIPDALNDDKISVSGSFRSYDENIVEKLYSEILKNDKELQNLDNEIQNSFDKSHNIRKELYSYDDKSKNYYSTAINGTKSINDSILKKKLVELVRDSETKYNINVSKIKKLTGIIESNNASITDNYTFFKTSLTIPIIEKYQKENNPSSQPLQNFINEQIKTKAKVEAKNK